MTRTTIVYSPHPDDETLYLGSYITICAARGDRLILVAATDGGASGAKPYAWGTDELMQVRRIEQTAAWRVLTNGRGTIIRLGSPDSKDPNLRAKITAKALELQKAYESSGPVEHYAAANNGMNQGVDHEAVALGLRDAKLPVARFANRCTDNKGGIYKPADLTDMKRADDSYKAFGHYSVASYFAALRACGYENRIVA